MKKIIVAGAIVLACGALVGCEDLDKAINEEQANDTPTVIKAGAAFEHDDFAAAKGWRIVNERYMGATIKGLKVTNTGGDQRTALLSFRLYDGKSVLAEISCSSKEMQKDEISTLECFGSDKLPKGKYVVKVADEF
jgi:hypothetical protein